MNKPGSKKAKPEVNAFFIAFFRVVGTVLLAAGLGCFALVFGLHFLSQSADDDAESEKARLLTQVRGAFEETVAAPLENIDPQAKPAEGNQVPREFQIVELDTSLGDPGFPPKGERLGVLKGLIFYEKQRRFAETEIEMVIWGKDIYLAGAGMCEALQSGHVLLKPCIFRDKILTLGEKRSAYEIQLVQTLNLFLSYEFTPFKRYKTSYHDCSGAEAFRMSIQFLERKREGFITLRLPFSDSETAALSDLRTKQDQPCSGLDIFFQPEEIVRMIELIDATKEA